MQFVKKHRTAIILVLIVLIAFFIRFWQLNTVPYGLHDDEVANAYVGKYILINHVDLYGNKWPILYFDKFGDFPPVLPMYLAGIGALLFGDTPFGARFITALIGSATVLLVYFLTLEIFKRRKTALLAAFFLAILPWHFVLSRTSAEGVNATAAFLLGIFLVIRGIHRNQMVSLVVGFGCMLLTFLLYPAFRIITPLALLPLPFLLLKPGNKTQTFNRLFFTISIIAVITAFSCTFIISQTDWGKGRFNQTSVFTGASDVEGKIQRLIYNESNITVARIFNNKLEGFSREIVHLYTRYFSPGFLFFEEGESKHYRIPNVGIMYLTFIPFFFMAIRFGFPKLLDAKNPLGKFQLWLLWLVIIAPIPAALTATESPNTHRSLLLGVLLVIIAAHGITLMEQIKQVSLKHVKFPLRIEYLVIVVFIVEIVFALHGYFQHTSMYTSPFRNGGDIDLVTYLEKNRTKYKSVVISNDQRWLAAHYLYYTGNYDIKWSKQFGLNFRLPKIANLQLTDSVCPSEDVWLTNEKQQGKLPKNVLYVEQTGCAEGREKLNAEKDVKLVKTIYRSDASKAFYLFTWK